MSDLTPLLEWEIKKQTPVQRPCPNVRPDPAFRMSDLTPLLSFCNFDVRYATCRTVLCFHHDY